MRPEEQMKDGSEKRARSARDARLEVDDLPEPILKLYPALAKLSTAEGAEVKALLRRIVAEVRELDDLQFRPQGRSEAKVVEEEANTLRYQTIASFL